MPGFDGRSRPISLGKLMISAVKYHYTGLIQQGLWARPFAFTGSEGVGSPILAHTVSSIGLPFRTPALVSNSVSRPFQSTKNGHHRARVLREKELNEQEPSVVQEQQLRAEEEKPSVVLPPATMATVSLALPDGGRQLRRRKDNMLPVSSATSPGGMMGSQQGRKKAKGSLRSPSREDVDNLAETQEETYATSLEARLWNLDKSDKLTTLTVVELRGFMKRISKPTAGRKEELISEVKKWLAERQFLSSSRVQATVTSSSDAESLEGALLKAETKSRKAASVLNMKEVISERDVDDIKVQEQDSEFLRANDNTRVNSSEALLAITTSKDADQKEAETSQPGSNEIKVAVTEVTETRVVVESTAGQKRKVQSVKTKDPESLPLQKKGKDKGVQLLDSTKVVIAMKNEPWTVLAHKKAQPGWVAYNPATMRPGPLATGTNSIKIISWNVNGIRGIMKNKKYQDTLLFKQLAINEDFDVLCLQETKLQEKDVEEIQKAIFADYVGSFWSCSNTKLGYSGVAIISRIKPVSVKYGMGIFEHDDEGRLITMEMDTFYLVAGYVPNSGQKLERLTYRTQKWDPAFSQYIKELEKIKPVVVTGDLNCAHKEIDIFNPNGNLKSAGFTQEERSSFESNFLSLGLVDTFRRQHPLAVGYTYWSYRTGARPANNGWRLDYFLLSETMVDHVHDSYILPEVEGSDHCPVGLILKL